MFPHPPRLEPYVRLSPHTAQHHCSISEDESSKRPFAFPQLPWVPLGQLARSLGSSGPGFPQARGLRHESSSSCGQLSCPQTTTPHPSLPEASGFRWGLPSLLPTPLHILQEASRVHSGGPQQNAVGGVLLNAPSPLWGSPVFLQGRVRLTWSPMRSHPMEEAWVLRCSTDTIQAQWADRCSKVCQGPRLPQGSARFR